MTDGLGGAVPHERGCRQQRQVEKSSARWPDADKTQAKHSALGLVTRVGS
jgi:hypothetical protein